MHSRRARSAAVRLDFQRGMDHIVRIWGALDGCIQDGRGVLAPRRMGQEGGRAGWRGNNTHTDHTGGGRGVEKKA